MQIPMRPGKGAAKVPLPVQLLIHNPVTFQIPLDNRDNWQPIQIVSKVPYAKVSFSPGEQSNKPAPMLMLDTGTPFQCSYPSL